jgi:MobA-like NTP transferase protein
VNVFFPMAGQGARFGHRFKPFLMLEDTTFIEAAVRPFRTFASRITRLVFVYLEEQERVYEVSVRLAAMFAGSPAAVKIETVRLDAPTRGPAETIARGVARLGARGPAMICDCDHSLDVEPLFAAFEAGRFDALLPVWPLDGEDVAAWSVARVEDGRVLAIAEKRIPDGARGVPMGVIGCYGFPDVAAVAARADALRATNFSDAIAAVLAEGGAVRAARIEHARFFGDPARLETARTGPPGVP